MGRLSKSHHKGRGQSIVEFALIGPLFILLIMGLIEGGRLIYTYNAVNHAAQEAARQGVLEGTGSVAEVKARAVAAADPLAIDAGDVTVEVNSGTTSFSDRALGDRLAVTVGHDFTPVVAMVFGSSAAIHLSGTSELMVE